MIEMVRRAVALAAALILLSAHQVALGQTPTAVLVQDGPAMLSAFASANSGNREVVTISPAQWFNCRDFHQGVDNAIAVRTIDVVVSMSCAAEMRMLAGTFPDVLFIGGSDDGQGASPDNLLRLLLPASVDAMRQGGQQRFGMPVFVSLCGGDARWQGGLPLFSCLVAPDGTDLSLNIDQLHYRAAIQVLDQVAPDNTDVNASQAKSQLAGRSVDTALGRLTLDSDGLAIADLPLQLLWNQDAPAANASVEFNNADSEDILTFLRDSVGPASAAISKVCGTTCPSQCNGSCSTEGSQKCCSVASEDPQP